LSVQRPTSKYDEPFHWWGPRWEPTARIDLAQLLRNETIDVADAAILWAALARLQSITVIGGPSRLGKTTLLSALLCFLPPGIRRLHLHGSFETFAFLQDPSIEPHGTALLINEISPHLPIYLWGPGVESLLAAAERGFTLLATAHGDSVPQFVGSLTGSPLRVPAPLLAALGTIVLLERTSWTASGRRVSGIWQLTAERGGLTMTSLRADVARDISLEDTRDSKVVTPTLYLPSEITRRAQILAALRDGEVAEIPEETVGGLPLSNGFDDGRAGR
jgi:hypothetical protein